MSSTTFQTDQVHIKANLSVAKNKFSELVPVIEKLTTSSKLIDQFQIGYICVQKAIELTSTFLESTNNHLSLSNDECLLLQNEVGELNKQVITLVQSNQELNKKNGKVTSTNTELKIKINKLSNQVTNLTEQLSQLDRIQKELDEKTIQFENSKANFNELKKLDPKGLQIKVTKQEKEIDRLQTKNKTASETSQKIINDLQTQVKILGKRMTLREGEDLYGDIIGKDKVTSFSIAVFEYALNFRMNMKDSFSLVDNLDWHVIVSSSKGINISVAVSEWLSPVPPPCQELYDAWPEDLNSKLHQVFMNRMKDTHPRLIARIDKSKQIFISTHPDFTDAEKKALKKCKFIRLFDAVCTSFFTFRKMMLDNSKFNEEEVRSIHARITALGQNL